MDLKKKKKIFDWEGGKKKKKFTATRSCHAIKGGVKKEDNCVRGPDSGPWSGPMRTAVRGVHSIA